MSLNTHERAFSVEEVSRIADADLAHFRVMLWRAGEDAVGQKRRDGRILFSAEEALAATIAVALIRFGMKTTDAFSFGRALACIEGEEPATDRALFYFRNGDYRLNCVDAQPKAPAITVPIASMWRRVQAECAEAYEKASA